MKNVSYRYLFGPVASRRLGVSLGVDLVPSKTCSFDCIFCEAGKTTLHTIERKEYVPVKEVIEELKAWFLYEHYVDYITLSGAGEPTLHSRFGEVLEFIKKESKYKTALLTNSSLLYLPEVRYSAIKADLVKASLGAWDDTSLRKLNQPAESINFNNLIKGLREFRKIYKGVLWLEIMVVPGINSSEEDMLKIRSFTDELHADKIQLNTVVRTPAYKSVLYADIGLLHKLANCFVPPAEIIGGFEKAERNMNPCRDLSPEEIKSIITRRPCRASDIAVVSGIDEARVSVILSQLVNEGLVEADRRPDGVYYAIRRQT